MDRLYNAFTLFLSLLVEAIPFLLLGVLLSSALLLLIDERQLAKRMPKNPILGSFVGSCVGFLFPVCECGNVPVARRLLMQGVPTSVAIGFLLAAPTINPIVIWSTWIAFRDRPEIVLLRIVFSLTIATIIGCIFAVQKNPEPLLQPALCNRLRYLKGQKTQQSLSGKNEAVSNLLQSGTYILGQSGQSWQSSAAMPLSGYRTSTKKKIDSQKLSLFLDNLVQELRELGGMLVIGSAIAAAIQVFVPREIILSLGQGPITSIVAMMLLAAVVSICSTVDSFFALSFASVFTSGSLLAFLVFGPMIDLKAIGLMFSIFKPRMIIYLFAIAAQLTFIFTLSYSYLF
ncbi:MAG: permease [Oscillatoria sp. PMC 1068.18]|nr:permease [Oscillatoria sp. PMC 1076.18]MEC4990620.1 permease [Oscillatoria sp. PMC 1068.18]